MEVVDPALELERDRLRLQLLLGDRRRLVAHRVVVRSPSGLNVAGLGGQGVAHVSRGPRVLTVTRGTRNVYNHRLQEG
jgi:hypothetical protein